METGFGIIDSNTGKRIAAGEASISESEKTISGILHHLSVRYR